MATGAEVKGALEFAALAHRMIDDPDLTGDALLLALGAAERMHFPERYKGRPKSERSWYGIARRVFPARVEGHPERVLRGVLADDIPRYEWIDEFRDRRCGAPMIRREGKCGQAASITWGDRDPVTGEGKLVGLCRRHERSELGRQIRALRMERLREWRENGEPEPPANRGGVLARYFDTDWQRLYEWASPSRAARAKPDGKPATPPRPVLTLIRGDS